MEPLTPHHRPRRADYIGDSDQAILAFISNLAHQVETFGPVAFGLTHDDAAIIIAASEAYAAAFALASANSTRTPTAVLRKNETRDEADRISRRYAQIIKSQPATSVSDELKIIAGVPVDKAGRSRLVGGPATFPRLSVDTRNAHWLVPEVKVRFRDSELSSGRMPREDGVTHMILHAQVAPGEPGQVYAEVSGLASAMRVVGYVTRNPHTVRFNKALLARFGWRMHPSDASRPVFPCMSVMLRGQWLDAKGEVGPLGPAAMLNVVVRGELAAIEQSDASPLSLAA